MSEFDCGEVWSLKGTTDIDNDMLIQILIDYGQDVCFQRINDHSASANFKSILCPKANIKHVYKPLDVNMPTGKDFFFQQWEVNKENLKMIDKENKEIDEMLSKLNDPNFRNENNLRNEDFHF